MDSDYIDVLAGPLQSNYGFEPKSYYYQNLFCLPPITSETDDIYENLIGNKRYSTPMKLQTNHNTNCRFICKKNYSSEQKTALYDLIEKHYRATFFVDGLPNNIQKGTSSSGDSQFIYGFDIGFQEDVSQKHGLVRGLHYLFTHYNFTVSIFRDFGLGLSYIDSLTIIPVSPPNIPPCQFDFADSIENSSEFTFSYSISFKYVDDKPTRRWKQILSTQYLPHIKWSILANILVGVFFFSIIFFAFTIQFLKKERRHIQGSKGEVDGGWRVIKNDIFRTPSSVISLSTKVGLGFHFLIIIICWLVLFSLGLYKPSYSGTYIKTLFSLYLILSPVAGFLTEIVYSSTGIGGNKFSSLRVSIYQNISMFISLFVYIIYGYVTDGPLKLSIKRMIFIAFVFFMSTLLSISGQVFGLWYNRIRSMGESSPIPRKIPKRPIAFSVECMEIIGGFIIFIVIFPFLDILMKLVPTSYGLNTIFPIGLLSLGAMTIISIIVSIVSLSILVYYEDYEWWWASFHIPSHSGVYVLLYLIHHWMKHFYSSDLLENLYILILFFLLSLLVWAINGSIGFLSAYYVVSVLYKQ